MIRGAEASDTPAIMNLWNAMVRDTTATFTNIEKTQADIEYLIETRPNAFWMYGVGDGFVTWGPFRSGPGYANTVEHTIITAHQGQGVGRALMEHAFDHAARQGHHVMIAAISGSNKPAMAFHTALGFQVAGRLPEVGQKGGVWLDLILMHKQLIAA